MIISYTINKKNLENIINNSFSKFGYITSSFLLDSLKLLSFYYATNSGISVSIEDLKTPKIKNNLILEAKKNIDLISNDWNKGLISKGERFQNILYNWNNVTELLKLKIISYYKKFNPTNSLYIMAFSGARGNISQVSQLIGVRGLMVDQDGKTIDIPITTNFREGLSSVDYIVSSYGARKGIVDTALKTATSGYLTRRLIYATKNVILRELDCKNKNGIIVFCNLETNYNKFLGFYLNSMFTKSNINKSVIKNIFIDHNIIEYIKKYKESILNIRSIVTCNSNNLICQKCYGWDLSKKKIASLGDTVGITAAQSISEPGTQLTMRTFHTGGVFSTNNFEKIKSKYASKLIIPKLLKFTNYRLNNGTIVYKLDQDIKLKLINLKGIEQNIYLNKNSFLYFNKTIFLKKEVLVAENVIKSNSLKFRSLKPIYSDFIGEIYFNNLALNYFEYNNKLLKINKKDGLIWIKSSNIITLRKNIKYTFFYNIVKNDSLGYLNLISKFKGYVNLKNNKLIIFNKLKKITINFNINNNFKNYKIIFCPLVKNFQYVDKNTILGRYKFILNKRTKIYSLKKRRFLTNLGLKLKILLSYTKDKDIVNLNLDQVNNNTFYVGKYIQSKFINDNFLLEIDGLRKKYQISNPIFIKNGSIVNYSNKDFIDKNKIIVHLSNYSEESKDIVQGLPKIDELIEARIPNSKSIICPKPSILLNSDNLNYFINKKYEKNISYLKYKFKSLYSKKICISLLTKNNKYSIDKYKVTSHKILLNSFGNFINIGKSLTIGNKNPHELLNILFKYHSLFNGLNIGLNKSLNKFQLIFTNSIQALYKYQDVHIANKHIEIIIKNITSKANIINNKHSYFLLDESVKISLLNEIYKVYLINKKSYAMPTYEPKLISIKKYSLTSTSFIANASFQQTRKILTKAAVEGNQDWFHGLKESIILGRPMAAGSTFLNYKNYLDNIFVFKN